MPRFFNNIGLSFCVADSLMEQCLRILHGSLRYRRGLHRCHLDVLEVTCHRRLFHLLPEGPVRYDSEYRDRTKARGASCPGYDYQRGCNSEYVRFYLPLFV